MILQMEPYLLIKALVVDSNKILEQSKFAYNGTFTDGTASLTTGSLTGLSDATISSSSPSLTIKSTNISNGNQY